MRITPSLALSTGVGIGGALGVLAIERARVVWAPTVAIGVGAAAGALGGFLLGLRVGKYLASRGTGSRPAVGLLGLASGFAFVVMLAVAFSALRLPFADAVPSLSEGLRAAVLGFWTLAVCGLGFGIDVESSPRPFSRSAATPAPLCSSRSKGASR